VTAAALGASRLAGLAAITFDFGNTLVRVDRAGLHRVLDVTAERVCERGGLADRGAFLAAWSEERERQFREALPLLREVDLAERVVRVLARCRGFAPPPPGTAWDDEAAASRSTPDEVTFAVGTYSEAFVGSLPPAPEAGGLLERLRRRGFRLAILSNWPLAATIDRYAEASGWTRLLEGIVVSQRVGTIKPHPAIFRAAARVLGDPPPGSILHVGDDWDADVMGAKGAGWRAAYLRGSPADSPLPRSRPGARGTADLELDALPELEAWLEGPENT